MKKKLLIILLPLLLLGAAPLMSTVVQQALRDMLSDTGKFITFSLENDQSPSDGQVLKWNTGDTVTWEADAGAAGGDSVSIDGVSVVDPDFVSTADIDFIDTTNTVTADINAGVIDEANLDATNAPTDNFILSYNAAGTNFTWAADAGGAETNSLETTITAIEDTEVFIGDGSNSGTFTAFSGVISLTNAGLTAIVDGSIIEPDLSADVAAVDGDFLQYDSTGTNFTWRNASETLSDIGITATASEVNTPLDGASVILTEFQELEAIDATTISTTQWAGLGGATAAGLALWDDANNVAQLVTLGLTATASEINILDGALLDVTELNYVNGVTSAIQTQLDAKEGTLTNKAGLHSAISDVSDFAEADGDVYTGTHDFGGATDFEVINAAAPTVDTAGQMAMDTTITSHNGMLIYYDGATAMTIPAIPTADLTTIDGHVIDYNAAGNKFTMDSPAAGGETNSLEVVTTGIATTEIPIGTAADTVVYAALSGGATMTNGGVVTLQASSTTVAGAIEKATTSEINGGTGTLALTVDQFEASEFAPRYIEVLVNGSTDLTTGDLKAKMFTVPADLAGWVITEVSASRTTGTGTDTYMLRNLTQGQDILSVVLPIDTDDLATSTTQIDLAQDDLTLGDQLVADIDSVGSSTQFMSLQAKIEILP